MDLLHLENEPDCQLLRELAKRIVRIAETELDLLGSRRALNQQCELIYQKILRRMDGGNSNENKELLTAFMDAAAKTVDDDVDPAIYRQRLFDAEEKILAKMPSKRLQVA